MEPERLLSRSRKAKARARSLALRAGLDIQEAGPASSAAALRQRLIADQAVDLVIDAGASVGHFARECRLGGYAGRIVSLEPIAEVFALLEREASGDPAWECIRTALGGNEGKAEFNVASNLVSSSLLNSSGRHLEAAPGSAAERVETVPVTTLNALAPTIGIDRHRAHLKLDLQGAELVALAAAGEALGSVRTIEAEASLVETYEGGPLLPELLGSVEKLGFTCAGIFGGFADRTSGRMLQADVLFERTAGG